MVDFGQTGVEEVLSVGNTGQKPLKQNTVTHSYILNALTKWSSKIQVWILFYIWMANFQLTFTCLKLTIETLGKGVQYVQS